jgi:exodeoxyribonuclease-3
MEIATWNVNSIKARLPNVLAWTKTSAPDILLLQEIKTVDEGFPRLEFEDLGYNVATHGQKTYNGVAILSKRPLDDVQRGLGEKGEDAEARYIEAFTGGLRVASVYVPNGQEVGSPKFSYKLEFLARLLSHAKSLLKTEEAIVIGGDYNVAPEDADAYDPDGWRGQVLCHPDERAAFRRLLNLGYIDAWRARHPGEQRWSWWDYRAGAWAKDHGLRIDHLLLSPQAVDRLNGVEIDRKPRGEDKASDHTPVWCDIADAK